MATLEQYQRHAEKFGPEFVVETAATELSEREVAELAAFIKHRHRIKRWKDGRWHEKPHRARACEKCGRDLPPDAGPRMRRHRSCKNQLQYARRKRQAPA